MGGRVRDTSSEKKTLLGKNALQRTIIFIFYGFQPSPTSLGSDTRVRCEGYDGPDLGEKCFQLLSIFIV